MTSDGASSVAGDEARIVIVGGGVGGLSTLYHLARRGIDDVLLLEQHELTSGTTWHAAGLCTQYSTSSTLMRALRASVELYRELEADTGQAVGFHPTGSLRLAPTHDHMDELRHVQGVAEVAGLPYALIDPEEARARFPLLDPAGIEGAAWLPTDGWIDPSSLAAAYARGARQRGARIRTGVRVTGLERRDGTWRIATSDGEVRAQTLVCAAGLWARELLGLAGARLPLVALPHHYVFTEPVPGLAAGGDELPVLRDPSARFYARQDNDGLIVGPFEQALEPWALDGVPRGWSRRLIKPDMRRILPALEAAAERIPLLGELGVKKALNGPDGYTPDGRCLMGPVPGLRDAYVLAGFSIFGIVWSGGAGLRMAEWLADGQPVDSMWELDVRRFGDHAGVAYTGRRAVQVYVREYDVHRPEEEWPAGRPLKTDPLYDRLTARGAVWASRNGWERPAFFAAPGEPQEDAPAFRRADAPWHEAVLREARAVRTAVGVLDQTSFGKYVVRGAGAEALLDRLSPNRLPGEIGRMALLQLLTERGGIECDLSATRIGPDAFYVVSAAGTAPHDLDWLRRHAPEDGSVEIEDVTSRYGVLTLAGPRSRELVGRLTRADVSREAFPFFSCRDLELAMAPVRAFRVSYVGELGFELHVPIEYLRHLDEAIQEAGAGLGLVDFGYRALDGMRLEKGFRLWGADMSADWTPYEAGLGRFVHLDKGPFIGRDALLRQREAGVPHRLALLAVDDAGADAHGHEPVFPPGRNDAIAFVAAGGFGPTVERSLALAYLPAAHAQEGTALELRILGERRPAVVVPDVLHDPTHERLRG